MPVNFISFTQFKKLDTNHVGVCMLAIRSKTNFISALVQIHNALAYLPFSCTWNSGSLFWLPNSNQTDILFSLVPLVLVNVLNNDSATFLQTCIGSCVMYRPYVMSPTMRLATSESTSAISLTCMKTANITKIYPEIKDWTATRLR